MHLFRLLGGVTAMPWERALDRAILVAAALLFGTILLASRGGAADVRASHPHSSPLHIGTMHNWAHEDFCAWVRDGSIAHSTVVNQLRQTLYLDNPAEDWDGLAADRVYFMPYSGSCPNLANRNDIQIEYWVVNGGCGPPDYRSCVALYDPYWNGAMGHTDYFWASVTFNTYRLTSGRAMYHHIINHETGHVLGLKDPDYYGQCVDSVMHSAYYGCGVEREWPSGADRQTVTYSGPQDLDSRRGGR